MGGCTGLRWQTSWVTGLGPGTVGHTQSEEPSGLGARGGEGSGLLPHLLGHEHQPSLWSLPQTRHGGGGLRRLPCLLLQVHLMEVRFLPEPASVSARRCRKGSPTCSGCEAPRACSVLRSLGLPSRLRFPIPRVEQALEAEVALYWGLQRPPSPVPFSFTCFSHAAASSLPQESLWAHQPPSRGTG